MEKYDVIIIGAGLGGLECGYILSKRGLKVCVLEKNSRTGGCLQTFRRGNYTFDTGFHYVGALDPGQPLHRLFSYFQLLDLPWRRLDSDCFDQIVLKGEAFPFANGYERFATLLAERFPRQRTNLQRYTEFLRSVGESIFDNLLTVSRSAVYSNSLFAQSAYDYLHATIDDPLLRNVLAGGSLKMELHPEALPLYTYAQINSAFIQSAWRLCGGGSQITDALAKSIRDFGGTVRTSSAVTQLLEENRRIRYAEVNGEEQIEAANFIADLHPANVLALIKKSEVIRNIFRKRIENLENTYSFFTVHLALKEDAFPYLNHNIFIYDTEDVWQYSTAEQTGKCALVSFQPPSKSASTFTRNIDLLTPMFTEETERWSCTTSGCRGAEYKDYTLTKAEKLIDFVQQYIPSGTTLRSAINRVHTSSNLTYRDYTGSPDGNAYGIRKNCNQVLTTLLSSRTPEPNLFLTGQNLNIHGVLGVSLTSFLTCAEIIGKDAVIEGL
jgi:all-trans-retinol 13,14-reductase